MTNKFWKLSKTKDYIILHHVNCKQEEGYSFSASTFIPNYKYNLNYNFKCIRCKILIPKSAIIMANCL